MIYGRNQAKLMHICCIYTIWL